MQDVLALYGPFVVALCVLVMVFGGFTKGAVGFALPTVAVSGIGTLMTVELAIAALILPSLVTNVQQSLRQGWGPARASFLAYWRLNLVMLLLIALFAQAVVHLPERTLFGLLGLVVAGFGLVQLAGWRPGIAPQAHRRAELATGGVAGVLGGLVGIWGPPILLFLLAREVPKTEMVRIQGISFLGGTLVLMLSHSYSGVLNASTVQFSALLIAPALVGMWVGQRVQDRLPQERFRKLTLLVLVLAGLNLARRAVMA